MSIYGFDDSDTIKLNSSGLPVGIYKVMVTKEDVGETKKDINPNPLIVTYEIIEGENKGKSAQVHYNVNYIDEKGTADIARGNLRRIADATGRKVTPSAPLKGRVFTVEVRTQKKNADYTEIARYLPESYETQKGGSF